MTYRTRNFVNLLEMDSKQGIMPINDRDFVPRKDDGAGLGTSEKRWGSVYAVDGVFSTLTYGSLGISSAPIGTPGAAGFGVGICPEANLPAGMTPLAGHNIPGDSNYGNYQFSDGSVMVFIPKFYYRIGHASNPTYSVYGVNSIDVKGTDTYPDTAGANAAGYALHRAFIDGGAEKQGFFVDKYMCSKNPLGTGYVASSIANGLPLSSNSAHNPFSGLTGGEDFYYSAIDIAHRRDGVDGAVNADSNFFCASMFIHSALAMLSMAHGQAASSVTNCAWYNATYNYPKGCNNNALKDVDDTAVTYVTDGYSNCGRTGSGSPFAKTTHNGQTCGVADLNGLMYEIAIGMTAIVTTAAIEGMTQASPCAITWTGHGLTTGDYVMPLGITQADWSGAKDKIWQVTVIDANTFTIAFDASGFAVAYNAGTDPGTVAKGTFYAAKQSTAMKDFTKGNSAATDHWGATGVAAMMDKVSPVFNSGAAFAMHFGNSGSAVQVLDEAIAGNGWTLAGLGLPKLATSVDGTGTNLFGKDYFYQYLVNDMCPFVSSRWDSAATAGVWCATLCDPRGGSLSGVGLRAACYPVS